MNCPYCGGQDLKVIDSRDAGEGIRRRRQCLKCQGRFTTYEELQRVSLFVIKKDQRREEFSKEKLLNGIRKACEKRPLPTGTIDKLADDIEAELFRLGKREVPGRVIGDMVMEGLKKLDDIAYIRFASVYLDFAGIADLKRAVDSLVSGDAETTREGQLPLLANGKTVSPIKSKGRSGARRLEKSSRKF